MSGLDFSKERKKNIEKLRAMVFSSVPHSLLSVIGSWHSKSLPVSRPDLLHLFESTYSGNDEFCGEHFHEESTEIFVVIKGTVDFGNGEILKAGETKTVRPPVPHNCKISKDGYVIVLLLPPEEAFTNTDKGVKDDNG